MKTKGYTVEHTETYYSFHNEIFFFVEGVVVRVGSRYKGREG